MKRREFIMLFGGAATAWPLAARAQQPALPVIGFLGATTADVASQRTNAFLDRLRELGWNEGRNLAIDYRWAEGSAGRSTEIAAEFAARKVNLIVTSGVPGTLAAKQATSVIPIVFAVAADPVGARLVESLARPGGNVTGMSNQSADTASKRLELLREVVPNLRSLALIGNVENFDPVLEMAGVEVAAQALGMAVMKMEIRRTEDIVPAFERLSGHAEALYVVADPLVNLNRSRIHTMAMGARLPTIYNARESIESGGLMSYGPNFLTLWRRAAELVDKILRGTQPADIPVEQPIKFDLVVNLFTAKALGVSIPATLLARADEVIE